LNGVHVMALRGTAAGKVDFWLLISYLLPFHQHQYSQAEQERCNALTLMPEKNRAYTESFDIGPELTNSTTLIP